MSNLVKYDEARNALQVCATIDEAKVLITQAEMMLAYAKQMKDTDMEIWVAEIRIRAKRKFGELSKETPKSEPKNQHSAETDTGLSKKESLSRVGVSQGEASRCEKLAAIDEEEFENVFIKAKEKNKPVTFADVEKTVIKKQKDEVVINDIEQQKNDIEAGCLPVLENKYHVISIDPPWPYELKYDDDGDPIRKESTYYSNGRRSANQYPEMSIKEITGIELPAADDSILWLWTTHRFLPDAFEILKAWGYDYKATMVWDKQKIGMGHWLRMQCEFCLMAVKGKPFWDNTTERDIMSVSRREHSRKPDEFFEMVNKTCRGAKLEYFSREPREGWEGFGNDMEKFDE